jgi:hypothetical protein
VHSADLTPKDDLKPYPFCGPAKDKPRPNFNPYCDVLLRDFVLCRLSHNNHFPKCGWVVLSHARTIPQVITMAGSQCNGGCRCKGSRRANVHLPGNAGLDNGRRS